MRALNDLIKERDASINRLQDKLDEAAKSFASQRNQSKDSHDVELQALSDQIESLKAEVDIYLREKDEARQVVKELRDNTLELENKLEGSVLELQRERDEARQVVKELRDNTLELVNKLENECLSNETLTLQIKTLNLDLARVRGELSGLQEDAKSTLRSFHQVQQELEYYFQYSRKQSEMLEANANLQQRAAILLSKSSK
jgi:chromosome segregation ATPase